MRRWNDLRRVVLLGRAGGALIVVGSLLTFPADVIVAHGWPRPSTNIATGIGLFAGFAIMLAPWNRLPGRALHALPPIAASLIVLGIATGAPEVARGTRWLFVLVAVFAASAFSARRDVAMHLGFIGLALLGSVTLAPDRTVAFATSVVAVPTIALVAAFVVILRERLEHEQARLARAAVHDPLTLVGNRRLLDERLAYELRRHRRTRRHFTLVLLDLDGFKAVNDTLGHPAGDLLLTQVAGVLQRGVREQDTVVRTGGDEFAVLAPETTLDQAQPLVQRISRELAGLSAAGAPLSASIGLSTFPADGVTADALLTAADQRERRSKHDDRAAAVRIRA